jgi:CMD domain protein
MSAEIGDVIDHLAGIEPGSSLDALRARRLQARENAQRSFLSLFEPAHFGDVDATDRFAVAAFVAGVHAELAVTNFYLERLTKAANHPGLVDALKTEIKRGKTRGPYGQFPAGPLSIEDMVGVIYHVSDDRKSVLDAKLTAALEHSHLLVFRPRDASPADMQALLDAGWSSTGIVVLSQLVAFISFQVRSVAGLRALGASLAQPATVAAKAG